MNVEEAQSTVAGDDEDSQPAEDDEVGVAIVDWWRGVLAVERAFEPAPPAAIHRMRLYGIADGN